MNNFTGTERVNQSGCPRFCPGCHDPFLLPTDRLAEKEQYIKKVLSSWHDRITVTQEVPAERCLRYREKVCLATEWGKRAGGSDSSGSKP